MGSKKDSGSCDRLLQMEPATITLSKSQKFKYRTSSLSTKYKSLKGDKYVLYVGVVEQENEYSPFLSGLFSDQSQRASCRLTSTLR